jgi:hypothetical protein
VKNRAVNWAAAVKGAGRASRAPGRRRGAVFHAGPADVVLAAALGALDDPVVALELTPREAPVLVCWPTA